MTGVFTINYPATMAVIDRMTKLVEKLTRINERYESKISTLSRCRGTTENPHNHDSQIAAYRKIISNNSKDIVDLGLLISQIFSLMVNTQMTDFFLTQFIKNMMSGDSNVPNPKTSVMGESLSEKAAKKAGVRVDSRGVPIINNGVDAQAYMDALNKLMSEQKDNQETNKDFVPIPVFNCFTHGEYNVISSQSVSGNVLTETHQTYLHYLTEGYANKDYYTQKGYIIDAYFMMGICFGESNASLKSTNPFGEATPLGTQSNEKAKVRALNALEASGLAEDNDEAIKMLNENSFYLSAARVLSYLDNGQEYGVDITVNYESLKQAMPNIERWRKAAETGSEDVEDYAYYYYVS